MWTRAQEGSVPRDVPHCSAGNSVCTPWGRRQHGSPHQWLPWWSLAVDHLDLNIVDWYLSWYMSNSVASVAEELYVLQ